ncbi:MAG: hypothetical protein QW515_02435 [Thermoplasmatales archaeon]
MRKTMPSGIPKDIHNDPRRKKPLRNPNKIENGGRKPLPIDWKKVENLIVHGCSGVQIAATLGIHPQTLYDRCVKDNQRDWTEYSYEFWEKGNAQLHAKQYQMAMKGDKTLMVWLGKNRLKQTDKIESTIDAKVEVEQKAILEIPDNGRRKK